MFPAILVLHELFIVGQVFIICLHVLGRVHFLSLVELTVCCNWSDVMIKNVNILVGFLTGNTAVHF